ncbi:MAG: sulfatase-modifying factor protein, partial [Verrucomicrobia bacterium]
DNPGSGKTASHPVHSVNWYDVVKWCNARSAVEGRTPCYNLSNWSCNWNADGYRLPTEAEREKAARGGLNGRRFGWGDLITHSEANYYSDRSYAYDVSPTLGFHPDFNDGGTPYTSPVGSFAPNEYGLYDMAGNVWEWCWDLYKSNYYGTSPSSDPRGAASSSYRVVRGGGWGFVAWYCRSAQRGWTVPSITDHSFGFRVCLPAD